MESIVAALISAIASIAVALISHRQQTAREETNSIGATANTLTMRYTPTKKWLVPIAALALWLVLSAIFISYNVADFNGFAMPIAILLLAGIRPIKPLLAASFVWLLYAIYYSMLPFSLQIYHPEADQWNFYVRSTPASFWLLRLGLPAISSVVAGFVCQWRAKRIYALEAL